MKSWAGWGPWRAWGQREERGPPNLAEERGGFSGGTRTKQRGRGSREREGWRRRSPGRRERRVKKSPKKFWGCRVLPTRGALTVQLQRRRRQQRWHSGRPRPSSCGPAPRPGSPRPARPQPRPQPQSRPGAAPGTLGPRHKGDQPGTQYAGIRGPGDSDQGTLPCRHHGGPRRLSTSVADRPEVRAEVGAGTGQGSGVRRFLSSAVVSPSRRKGELPAVRSRSGL